MIRTTLAILVCLLSTSVLANPTPVSCDNAFENVMKHVDENAGGFESIRDFFAKFSACEGSFGAAIGGAMTQSLNQGWAQIEELKKMFADSNFKNYFLSHLEKATAASELHLRAVVEKTKNCSKALSIFCAEVEQAANKALKAIEEAKS